MKLNVLIVNFQDFESVRPLYFAWALIVAMFVYGIRIPSKGTEFELVVSQHHYDEWRGFLRGLTTLYDFQLSPVLIINSVARR